MAFEAKEMTVDKLLNDAIYLIPRNQRRYVWTNQNWVDMYDDILLVADKIAPSHFIGSIVLKDEGKEDGLSTYTVIDGQQRILTLTIFLTAIMFTMKKKNYMDDFGGTQKYLVARDIKNRDREIVLPEHHLTLPKMVTTILSIDQQELSSKSVTAFVSQCTMSRSSDKNIVEAFKFFASKISDITAEELLSIRDALIAISYVNITSSTDEDSYTIFEILNARGLDLEDHELLKNYVMRYLQPIAKRDEAKIVWDEIEKNLGTNLNMFFRHYALHKYNYNVEQKKNLSVYKTIHIATKGRNVNVLLDDLRLKSAYYARILNPIEDNKIEYDVFNLFKRYRFLQFRPLLLSLMYQKENGMITQQEYSATLSFLRNFFICYKIIGEENSNKLSDTVYKFAHLIENGFSDTILLECINSFKQKIPPLQSFINSFRNLGWSNYDGIYRDSKNKERCKLVLELIEKYVSNREINLEVTIEHIFPDSQGIKNAQIGNLFLLERTLNDRCGSKPLNLKFDIYDESSLSCPKRFVHRYRNEPFEPADRTDFLAKFVYNNVLGKCHTQNSQSSFK